MPNGKGHKVQQASDVQTVSVLKATQLKEMPQLKAQHVLITHSQTNTDMTRLILWEV